MVIQAAHLLITKHSPVFVWLSWGVHCVLLKIYYIDGFGYNCQK